MRRILKLIRAGSNRVSEQGRNVLGWLSRGDHPIKSQERQAGNLRLLEHAIKTGQPVTFNFLNKNKEERYRKMLPKRLFRRKEVIYCRIFDARRKAYRAFRLDGISGLKIDLRRKGVR